MQLLRAVAHPEHRAELAQAPRRQPVAGRQAHVLAVEALVQRAHALAIVGVALVVAPAALERARVGRAVDVVDAVGRAAAGRR